MIPNNTNETIQSVSRTETPEKIWRPVRDLVDVDTTVDTITNLQRRAITLQVATDSLTADAPATSSQALQVTSVSATESPFKTQSGQVLSLVSVSFTPNPADPQFAGIEIWFTGFNGSSVPQLMADGRTSPVQFLCDTTHETVTVTVTSYHADGTTTDITTAPTTTLLLDGVTSAPPAPSIAQSLVAIPLGYQFAFNQLAALGADLIDSYRVYRASSNSFAAATLLRTIKHSPLNTGPVVIQDMAAGGVTFYYWITAVNTSALESTETAAQSGAVSTFAGSLAPNYSSYTFTSPTVLSQTGTTTAIAASASVAQFPSGTVSYNSGSVNPGVYRKSYIYADDPSYNGGAVTYIASASNPDITANPGRIYFGSITTVAGGGGSGGGGGNGPCFGMTVKLANGTAMGDVRLGDEVLVELDNGTFVTRCVYAIVDHFYCGPMYDMGDGEFVTPGHHFRDGDKWVRADEIFTDQVMYSGWVRNLHICTDKEEEHNYVLANGRDAHNLTK